MLCTSLHSANDALSHRAKMPIQNLWDLVPSLSPSPSGVGTVLSKTPAHPTEFMGKMKGLCQNTSIALQGTMKFYWELHKFHSNPGLPGFNHVLAPNDHAPMDELCVPIEIVLDFSPRMPLGVEWTLLAQISGLQNKSNRGKNLFDQIVILITTMVWLWPILTLASTTPPEWWRPAATFALQRLEVVQDHLAYSMFCVCVYECGALWCSFLSCSCFFRCEIKKKTTTVPARSSCHQNLLGRTEPVQPRQASCPGIPSPVLASAPWSHHELESRGDLRTKRRCHNKTQHAQAQCCHPWIDGIALPSWIFRPGICTALPLPLLLDPSLTVLQPLELWCAAVGCRWRGPSNQPNSILEVLSRSMPSEGLLQAQNAKHCGYNCADCNHRNAPARVSTHHFSPFLCSCEGRILPLFEDLLSV